MLEKTNLLGAMVAIAFFVSASLVFTFRLVGKPTYGHWFGYFEFLLAIPLVLYGVARYLFIIYEKKEADSPELALLRDIPLLVTVRGLAY